MKQVHLVKVDTQALVPGMYVAELDCDWIDSPFLMQGFQLTEMEDLRQLQALCAYVFVDIRRSDADSVRLLLETHPPVFDKKPDLPLQRIQRATASFVDTPVQAPVRGGALPAPDRTDSPLGTLGTILNQTLRSPSATAAVTSPTVSTLEVKADGDLSLHGARAWRDQGSGVQATARPDAGGLRTSSYVVSSAEAGPAQGRSGLFRTQRRTRSVALDEAADTGNLSGPALLVAQEKQIVATPELQRANAVLERTDAMLATFFTDLQAGRELDFESAQRQIAEIAESISEHPEPLKLLASIKRHDNYAYKHALDCPLQMMSFARHQGFARDTVQTLGYVGMLLDVGKMRVPAEVRNHTGALTAAQLALMQHHVIDSIDILRDEASITTDVKEIVAQHHECIDGSGYPRGLAGREIDKRASMARIVDAYTAMLSNRPHRAALSSEEAFAELRRYSGTRFDAQLVEDFIQSTGSFAVGCVVELNTGEVGIVVRVNRTLRLKPVLLLVQDRARQPLTYPVLLDLMLNPEAPGGGHYTIRRELPADSHDLDPNELFFGGLA